MAWRPALDASATSAVRDRIEALPTVERAVLDEPQNLICLICRSGADLSGLTAEVRAILNAEGVDPSPFRIETVVRPDGQAGGRARFDSIEVIHEPDHSVRVRVSLEWDGRRVTGEAVGERGDNIELRTSVAAALSALEQLTEKPLGIRPSGVKQIRAFDAELMVVSLYRPGMPGQKLLGAVLMGKEPHRSAALALLNALNRVLGNYLTTR
ncbi:MAG: hypothetical protein ACREMQ_00645 [Longimicrobiales bacterium]